MAEWKENAPSYVLHACRLLLPANSVTWCVHCTSVQASQCSASHKMSTEKTYELNLVLEILRKTRSVNGEWASPHVLAQGQWNKYYHTLSAFKCGRDFSTIHTHTPYSTHSPVCASFWMYRHSFALLFSFYFNFILNICVWVYHHTVSDWRMCSVYVVRSMSMWLAYDLFHFPHSSYQPKAFDFCISVAGRHFHTKLCRSKCKQTHSFTLFFFSSSVARSHSQARK